MSLFDDIKEADGFTESETPFLPELTPKNVFLLKSLECPELCQISKMELFAEIGNGAAESC